MATEEEKEKELIELAHEYKMIEIEAEKKAEMRCHCGGKLGKKKEHTIVIEMGEK